jgi:hypothetical protein
MDGTGQTFLKSLMNDNVCNIINLQNWKEEIGQCPRVTEDPGHHGKGQQYQMVTEDPGHHGKGQQYQMVTEDPGYKEKDQ